MHRLPLGVELLVADAIEVPRPSQSMTAIERLQLAEGWESRHYLERTPLPVLEVAIGPGGAVLETRIDLRCAA